LLHLSVDSITTANGSAARIETSSVAPIAAPLAVRTVTSHVPSIATDTTNNVGGEITLFRTVVFAMADLTAVLASLVLIVTKCTVKRSQLSKLVPLEFVLSFRDRGSRLDNIVHQLLCFVNLLFSICHNQTMKVFFLVASVSSVRSAFSFLDGAFATDSNFCTGLGLHLLQSVSTRTYE
jgi:hypothetical protein